MKHIGGRQGVLYLAVLAAAAVFFFRTTYSSGGSIFPLLAFLGLMLLVFLLSAAGLPKGAQSEAPQTTPLDAGLTALGLGLLAAGCVLRFGQSALRSLLATLGLVSAVCVMAAQVLRLQKKEEKGLLYVPLIVFYMLKLFFDFRGWMNDPAISDYCFTLFASITFLLSAYHAGAFCYGRGCRRKSAFLALCGVLFCAAAMPGLELSELLHYGGSALWMLVLCAQAQRPGPEGET